MKYILKGSNLKAKKSKFRIIICDYYMNYTKDLLFTPHDNIILKLDKKTKKEAISLALQKTKWYCYQYAFVFDDNGNKIWDGIEYYNNKIL